MQRSISATWGIATMAVAGLIAAGYSLMEGGEKEPVGPAPKVTIVEFDASGQRGATVQREMVRHSEAEWKRLLPPTAFWVTRKAGTERAGSGEYDKLYEPGIYRCVACNNALFRSETKFRSGTGWPSFWEPIARENVTEKRDISYGMVRTEVLCTLCGSHLGHVFDDGPPPTGLRYCMNSAALKFEAAPQ